MCSIIQNVLYPARARSNVRPDWSSSSRARAFPVALGSLCGGGPAEEGGTMIGIGSLPGAVVRHRFGFVPKRPSNQWRYSRSPCSESKSCFQPSSGWVLQKVIETKASDDRIAAAAEECRVVAEAPFQLGNAPLGKHRNPFLTRIWVGRDRGDCIVP
jgi:hypothetical protein